MSLLLASLRRFAYLLLSLLILLALLIATPFGAQALFTLANSLQQQISLEYQSGTLARGVTLTQLTMDTPNLAFNIEKLSMEWRLGCLLNRHLCIQQLTVEHADIQLRPVPTQPTPAKESSAEFSLPLSLALDAIQLNHVAIHTPQAELAWQQLLLSASLQDNHLKLKQLAWHAPQITLVQPAAPTTPATNSSASAAKPFTLPVPLLPEPLLPEIKLPITGEIQQFSIHGLMFSSGEFQLPATDIALNGRWQTEQLQLTELQLSNTWLSLNHRSSLVLTPPYPVQAQLDLILKDLSQFKLPIPSQNQRIGLSLSGDQNQLNLNTNIRGAWQAQLNAKLALQPNLPYSLQVELSDLALLLAEPIQLQKLKIDSQGDLNQQQLQLQAEAKRSQQPLVTLDAKLINQEQQLTLKPLQLKAQSAGALQLAGTLNYRDGMHWQGELEMTEFNLQPWLAEFPSQLSGKVSSSGRYRAPNWQVSLPTVELQGTLLKQPLQLDGKLAIDSALQLPQLELALDYAGIQLSAAGKRDGNWQVQGQFQLDEQQTLLANISPDISGTLSLSGTQLLPQLQLKLGGKIAAPDINLQGIALQASYAPAEQHRFASQLAIATLKFQQWQTDAIQLHSHGDIEKQQLNLSANGDLGLQLAAAHQLNKQQSSGQLALNQFSLFTPWQDLQLQQPTSLDWGAQQAQLQPFCLDGSALSLCLSEVLNYQPEQVSAAFELALQSETLSRHLLPSNLALDTQLTGLAKLDIQSGVPHIDLQLEGSKGQLYQRQAEQKQPLLDWQALQFHASLDDLILASSLELASDNAPLLSLAVNSSDIKQQQLDAKLNLSPLDLQPYKALSAELSQLQGMLKAELNLRKPVQGKPELNGEVKLENASLALRSNPMVIENLHTKITLEEQFGQLVGQFNIGNGQANFQGKADWREALQAKVALNSQALEIIYPPYLLAKADSQLQLNYAEQLIQLQGQLAIPNGQITLDTLPEGSADISKDAVYLPQDTTQTPSEQLAIDLQLKVGEQLKIVGQGLEGLLSGELDIKQTPGTPLQLFGSVNLLEASYRAWGQDLEVETGRFTFHGLPSEPNLALRAFRQISKQDVTAGVELSGTPSAPQLEFYSTPAMPQPEILSYIVRGRGLKSEDDENFATTAALSAGIAATSGIFKQLDVIPGLSDIALDTAGTGAETQVTISSQVGERIYLKYGVGVFEPINELTVRLSLLKKLWLESVSGIEQSFDVYYSFDID